MRHLWSCAPHDSQTWVPRHEWNNTCFRQNPPTVNSIYHSPFGIPTGKMLPRGCHVANYNSPLSGNHKYLEFEVGWKQKKKKKKDPNLKLEFGNKPAKPQIPRNAFDRHCIIADLFCKGFWRIIVSVSFFFFSLLTSLRFTLPAEHILWGDSRLPSLWEREVLE